MIRSSGFRTVAMPAALNRHRRKHEKIILAAASVAVLALVGPAAAQSPIIIKFSHVVAPNTPKGRAPRNSRNWLRNTPAAR
jgi:hypothetical protein